MSIRGPALAPAPVPGRRGIPLPLALGAALLLARPAPAGADDGAAVPAADAEQLLRVDTGHVPRAGLLDVTRALQQRGLTSARLTVKIGNGGGFGSRGTIRVLVDGQERARSREPACRSPRGSRS